MIRCIVLLFVAAVLACQAADAQSYSVTTSRLSSYPYLTPGTTLALGDDAISPAISPTGFSFNYFGTAYTSFRVGSNGYLVMGGSGTTTAAVPDHAVSPGLYIAPFWTDLLPHTGSAVVKWHYENSVLSVEWRDVLQRNITPGIYNYGVTMLVELDTSGGKITFRYGDPQSGVQTLGATSSHNHCVAISSAINPNQEIIIGELSGAISSTGQVTSYPSLCEIMFTPVPTTPPPGGLPPFITSTPVTTATAGQLYTYTLTATGVPAPTFQAGFTLPGWLSLMGDTLSGTPNAGDIGVHSVLVSAVNAAGSHDQNFDITVSAATVAPQITSSAPLSVVAGNLYSYTITATGTPAPALSAAGLPPWLSLAGNVLSGVPGAGDTGTAGPITVSAVNSAGTDTQVFSVTVAATGGSGGGTGGGSGGGGCIAVGGSVLLPLLLPLLAWRRRRK